MQGIKNAKGSNYIPALDSKNPAGKQDIGSTSPKYFYL